MRNFQKKSNIIYYIIGIIILLALGIVLTHELPFKAEHIEEVIK